MSKVTSKKETRLKVFRMFDGRCAYCGCQLDFENFCIDHIIPLRRGEYGEHKGKDNITNFNPACSPCNYHKSTLSIEKWRESISKLTERVDRDSFAYRMAKRYGLIEEKNKPVKFFYESWIL